VHLCGSETHTDKDKSFCTLPIFHELVDPKTRVANGRVSKDGHQFACSHNISFHVIFVIDKSGSMSSTDVKPDDKTGSYKIIQTHDNRLGAVYECVKQFVRTRCGVNRTNQIEDDIMSIVLFDNDPTIVVENRAFDYDDSDDSLIDELCKYETGSGTNFAKAISTAGNLIQKYKQQARWE